MISRSASPHFGRYLFPIPQGQEAELAWVAGYVTRWCARPKTVTRPSRGLLTTRWCGRWTEAEQASVF